MGVESAGSSVKKCYGVGLGLGERAPLGEAAALEGRATPREGSALGEGSGLDVGSGLGDGLGLGISGSATGLGIAGLGSGGVVIEMVGVIDIPHADITTAAKTLKNK